MDEFFAFSTLTNLLCGIVISGSSKTAKRRILLGFDLSAPPTSGVAPQPGDTITAADLLFQCDLIDGIAGSPGTLYRITRDDWLSSSWTDYKAGAAWTTPGGDYAAPLAVPFTAPAAIGAWTVPGLLALVTDAYANRSARLHVLLRIDGEGGSFTTHFGVADRGAAGEPLLQLTVGAGAVIDDRDPAIIRGETPRRVSAPSAAGRAVSPARPASPRRT